MVRRTHPTRSQKVLLCTKNIFTKGEHDDISKTLEYLLNLCIDIFIAACSQVPSPDFQETFIADENNATVSETDTAAVLA